MKVSELIEELKKFRPGGAQVQTCYDCGCYQSLEAEMIRVRKDKFSGVSNTAIVVLHCE